MVCVVVFTDLFAPWSSCNPLCIQFKETSLTQKEMLSFPYACALEGVCADSSVSRRRSKTDNHLYRLQCFASSAYMVATSRSKREMTVKGWKMQMGKEKKKLKRKAILAVKADSLCTRIFTQELGLAGS